jgi:hypothetical protein
MAKTQFKSKSGRETSDRTAVLGRSALTGQFVYKPAPAKGGTISQKQVETAVRRIYGAQSSR